jgi:hypothetical protein
MAFLSVTINVNSNKALQFIILTVTNSFCGWTFAHWRQKEQSIQHTRLNIFYLTPDTKMTKIVTYDKKWQICGPIGHTKSIPSCIVGC